MEIIGITGDDGAVIAPEWFQRAEAVHRQLRDKLPADYAGKMRRVFGQGARMCVAAQEERVLGVAIYRIYENTFDGVKLYVDDLVTDAASRSAGVGHALMAHLEGLARERGCDSLTLDSGTQRHRAHAFYFREGMVITSYSFKKPLARVAA